MGGGFAKVTNHNTVGVTFSGLHKFNILCPVNLFDLEHVLQHSTFSMACLETAEF